MDGGGGGGSLAVFLFLFCFSHLFLFIYGELWVGSCSISRFLYVTCGGSSEMRGWSRSDIISGPAGGASGAKDGIGFGSDWIALSQDLLMTRTLQHGTL